MSESFAALLEESLDTVVMKEGSLVSGVVIRIDGDFVTVDAGSKSEAIIPVNQFLNEAGELTVQVGDTVDTVMDAFEDSQGETRLSREKAKRAEVWKRLEAIHEAGESIEGIITGKVKGGFTVDLDTVKAFLPGSLIDVRPLRDTSFLENRPLEFKVIKIDAKRTNVVVSRRAVIEQETKAEREALLDSLAEGQEVDGVVKNLTDYGAFIDLGGIDGLLHITDMSWKRIRHPSEMLNVGDEIKVKVLKFDPEKSRVSLGIKQLGSDPWHDLADRFPIGSRFSGKVTNITDYGCFVELDAGIEGLVHVSEMDWTNKNVSPSKIVHLDQQVEVMVLDVDQERRRVSLGLKQCIDNPWEQFSSRFQKGDKVTGAIKSITDFGVFIGLDGNIDGLIHMSDLSWTEPGEEAVKQYAKGQDIEAVVLSVDPERERISLGIKQLETDVFSDFAMKHEKGEEVKGTITEVTERSITVDLGDGINGFVRAADLAPEKLENAHTRFNEGDEVEAIYMGIDRRNNVVSLSIRALYEEAAGAAQEQALEDQRRSTTIGDLIKEKMNR